MSYGCNDQYLIIKRLSLRCVDFSLRPGYYTVTVGSDAFLHNTLEVCFVIDDRGQISVKVESFLLSSQRFLSIPGGLERALNCPH